MLFWVQCLRAAEENSVMTNQLRSFAGFVVFPDLGTDGCEPLAREGGKDVPGCDAMVTVLRRGGWQFWQFCGFGIGVVVYCLQCVLLLHFGKIWEVREASERAKKNQNSSDANLLQRCSDACLAIQTAPSGFSADSTRAVHRSLSVIYHI